jgi:hypothetical protein
MYDYCKNILLLFVLTTLVLDPEEGECAETCRSKLIVKYTICGLVFLLLLIESEVFYLFNFIVNKRFPFLKCLCPSSAMTQ